MKFSWKLINYFISIDYIPIKTFEEKLALSGIEIEEIREISNTKDKIINAGITSNRKDIFSAISLAKELGIIINYQLKIKIINNILGINKYKQINKITEKSIQLSISEIKNLHLNETPKWINSYLEIYDIKSLDIINNIKKYIEIKWGQTFDIFTKNELLSHLNVIYNSQNTHDILLCKNIVSNYSNKSNFLVFSKYDINKSKKQVNNTSCPEYYLNSYLDTTKILKTFTKCIVGKIYHIINLLDTNIYKETIEVDKHIINTTLGRISYKYLKNTSYTQVLLTLNQLNLIPKYNQTSKRFSVKIPHDRKDDLRRAIDIVEEIGRIQGYDNFWQPLNNNNPLGQINKASMELKQIRKILLGLGLNEVINSCLVNKDIQNKSIKIYNPLTQDQSKLRTSILENLLDNYLYNSKHQHTNSNVEIFEIGKVFQKGSNKTYKEKIHLAGLIYNNRFTRNNWNTQATNFNFFHLKGMVEILLEQLNSKATLEIIDKKQKNNNYFNVQYNLFDKIQNLVIYDKKNKEITGVLGKVNKTCKEYTSNNNIYAFELDINKLSLSIAQNNHLNYQVQNYSHYPSVIRDLSIQVNKTDSIESIQKIFSINRNPLIQSVNILNEYLDQASNQKSISLRITYQSTERTLDTKDITKIDKEVYSLLSKFESKT